MCLCGLQLDLLSNQKTLKLELSEFEDRFDRGRDPLPTLLIQYSTGLPISICDVNIYAIHFIFYAKCYNSMFFALL